LDALRDLFDLDAKAASVQAEPRGIFYGFA
jgi:hypothetical protein